MKLHFCKVTGSILQISSIQSTLNKVKEKLQQPTTKTNYSLCILYVTNTLLHYVHAYEFACYFV